MQMRAGVAGIGSPCGGDPTSGDAEDAYGVELALRRSPGAGAGRHAACHRRARTDALQPCWDPGLRRASLQVEGSGAHAGVMMEMLENESCTAPADQSALEVGTPMLDGIDLRCSA